MNRTMLFAVLALPALVSSAHAQTAPKPDAATTTVAAARLPAVKLTAERDSFYITVNARAIGISVYSITPTATGFSVKENTSAPSMGVQNTEVTTDAAGHPLKVHQTGLMGGQNVALDLVYANGRAKGTAKLPGAETAAIDAAVPPNVIDDNMLQAILPNLPWAPDAKWELPVFSGATDALSTQTLVVTDEVPVSIPSGKYDAYRAELRSADAVVAFYISKAAPHRILKIAAGGAPFEYVRAD